MKSKNISNNELNELIELSFEQAKRICTCKDCYKETVTPLILPVFKQQKVILLSEAPWNFPPSKMDIKKRCFHWEERFRQDLKSFLYNELGSYLTLPKPQRTPENIFEFINLTFHPLFRKCKPEREERIRTFLSSVYWTHMGKRSLKGVKKGDAISKCLRTFPKELRYVRKECGNNIRLTVVCTSYFCNKFMKCLCLSAAIELQSKILETEDRLLKISDILPFRKSSHKAKFPLEECVEALKLFKNCYIAFFPNPSGANVMKEEFFNRSDIDKLLDKIYSILQSVY